MRAIGHQACVLFGRRLPAEVRNWPGLAGHFLAVSHRVMERRADAGLDRYQADQPATPEALPGTQ